MRTTPTVAAQLRRLEDRLDLVERILAEHQQLAAQSGAASFAQLPPPAMPLNPFLGWAKLTRRQYYGLRDKGVLRSVIVGERSVYVVVQSYLDHISALDRAQNGPDAPPRPAVNPPPGRWGQQRGLGSAVEVVTDAAAASGAEVARQHGLL
jgi:hypothetical protein